MTATAWLKLAQKTAIVTGAGSGIGAAVAIGLAKQDCRVVLADVNEKGMENVMADVAACATSSTPQQALKAVRCNVTCPDQVKELIRQADEFASPQGAANILVNCAGITRDSFVSKMTLEQFDDVVNVNLRGTFLTCQAFCDSSRWNSRMTGEASSDENTFTAGGGAIVNVGSIVSEQGNLGQVNYAASKGGVLGLTRALAKEMACRNIRVNAVVPGFIDSEMTLAVPEKVRQQIMPKIALGRFGKPQDVANLVLFLASCERSAYITGECMACSGMISL